MPRLLSEFKKLPLSKQNNKMLNQESFLEQSLAKDRYSTALETARGELPEGVEQSHVRKLEWKWDIAEFEYDGFERDGAIQTNLRMASAGGLNVPRRESGFMVYVKDRENSTVGNFGASKRVCGVLRGWVFVN
ncbi:hypothetical protein J1N35_045338 [Gossypium stocksii]|uniref:Uncharacterized protein n=1 Tax=Gossypium stocksii TaxID=47602 RepID=A0A9D3UB34_9ROSI|nr:hypothetical protein J1N35_045338 [Gossypium stocksii]